MPDSSHLSLPLRSLALDFADPTGAWDPLSVGDVCRLFGAAAFPWWIAGGWAIDLFVGRQTRSHTDTDVLVLRQDQLAAQELLATGNGWELFAADPPGTLRRWQPGERLPIGVHDIWCRRGADAPWGLQLMLAETDVADATRWVFRRDVRIGGLLARLGHVSSDGTPFLAPEVQLLDKAKNPLPKNEADFDVALPLLAPPVRTWLAQALATWDPTHRWLTRLTQPGRSAQDECGSAVRRIPLKGQGRV